MAEIIDDKSEHCIPFILERLQIHRQKHAGRDIPPFILGLNGVQGAGKTTLVSTLSKTLSSAPHSLRTVVLSIDDLYLTHTAQVALAHAHPTNPLVQHRGQPSTHDLALGISTFRSLLSKQPTPIPAYDKSQFNGQGDRVDPATWKSVNEGEEKVEVVIFEGWCVGFRALNEEILKRKWEAAVERVKKGDGNGRLGRLKFEDVKFVNDALRGYDVLTDYLDAFIHIDARDPRYVYRWRLEQESALRASKGSGMTDKEVFRFVDGYYPAYELFTDTLQAGIFPDQPGKQLRLVVGEDRKVEAFIKI